VLLPARGFDDLSQGHAPWARFIVAITSAFLLPRDSASLFCARVGRGTLVGDFFAFPLAVATSAAGCAGWVYTIQEPGVQNRNSG
jgi:membrane protein YqaA with SNARE-associated domain